MRSYLVPIFILRVSYVMVPGMIGLAKPYRTLRYRSLVVSLLPLHADLMLTVWFRWSGTGECGALKLCPWMAVYV